MGFESSVEKDVEKSKPKGDMGKNPLFVEAQNNEIFFYSDVIEESVFKLVKELKKVEAGILHRSVLDDREPAPLVIRINSGGGYVTDGFLAMDAIKRCRVPVTTVVEGCCASAATFLSLAGNKRVMTPNSVMLIHQMSGCSWGKYYELVDEMKNARLFMKMIRAVYKEGTSIPKKDLARILKHDLWFDAKKCLKYGLVDEILD